MPQPNGPTDAPPGEEFVVEGLGVSPGIVHGPAIVYAAAEVSVEPSTIDPDGVDAEVDRFQRARDRSQRELRKVATFAREKLGETSADIFEAQIMVLDDDVMIDEVTTLIRRDLFSADYAIQQVLNNIRLRIEGSSDEYLRERAGDIVDVQTRIVRNLQQARAVSKIDPDHIVIAEHLTAADLLLFSRRNVLGVAIDFGGPTSHVSIMARSLGVPAVVSLHDLTSRIRSNAHVIVDGFSGKVVVNPSPTTLSHYTTKSEAYTERIAARGDERLLPAETLDGTRISLRSNVELVAELDSMQAAGSEGIGLFRTEMLLLATGRPLDEEEQLSVYRNAVRASAPHVTTFRLIDLGGDKLLPMAHREHNPFLGWRGVRILIDRPDVVRPQLRALMRAATEGPIRVLIPMISSLEEVHLIREAWYEAARELASEGIEHQADVPLGVMVEVPAVALAADRYAREVDFMSIGTNDLTQFLLAVDRGNDMVSGRYRELHPVLLRLIAEVVRAGERSNIPVSLCGEMASNPRLAPLLIGLGLRELSASPIFLADIKLAIRSISIADAEELAAQALEQSDAQSVTTLVDEWIRHHLPDLAPYFNGNLFINGN